VTAEMWSGKEKVGKGLRIVECGMRIWGRKLEIRKAKVEDECYGQDGMGQIAWSWELTARSGALLVIG
jgi:hypothetical protein